MLVSDFRDEYIGETVGRWTILKKDPDNYKNVICTCKCSPDVERMVDFSSIKSGKSKSCGCISIERTTKHGLHKHRLYKIFMGMKNRCYNSKNTGYKNYGGRGIQICQEWLDDFINFYTWAIDNGYDDNLTIDRINNDKGYSPDNCRWVNKTVQNNNTSRNVYTTINGKSKTLSQWAHENNLKYDLVWKRYEDGIRGVDLIAYPSVVKIHTPIIVTDDDGEHEFKTQCEAAKYIGVSSASIHKYISHKAKPRGNITVERKER